MQTDGYIDVNRSSVANEFLKSDFNVLFWIDQDMVWKPEDFIRILVLSTKMDIVGATYVYKNDQMDFVVSKAQENTWNEYGCIPCEGLGLGFVAMTRKVIQTMADRAPEVNFANLGAETKRFKYMFHPGPYDGTYQGEDITFFRECREAGFQPYLDPTITLGHAGTKVYSASCVA